MGQRCNEQFVDQFSTKSIRLLHSFTYSDNVTLTLEEGGREGGWWGGGGGGNMGEQEEREGVREGLEGWRDGEMERGRRTGRKDGGRERRMGERKWVYT